MPYQYVCWIALAAALLLAGPGTTRAQTELVKDINPGASYDSNPQAPVDLDGRLFFTTDDETHGYEPWISDGTEVGTQLVEDVYFDTDGFGPEETVALNEWAFFSAKKDDTSYRELWVSDGTAEGTVLVKDINPGRDWSNPEPDYKPTFVASGGHLYFAAEDPDHGVELWKTDGNPARSASLDPANLQPIDWSDLNLEVIFNSLGTAADLDAVRDLTPPDPATLSLPDAQGLAVDALWSLTLSDNTASFDADVCLAIDDLVVPGLPASDLRLYKRPDASSTTWTQLTSELRPASSPTQICAVGITGFSQFAVTAAEGALPVERAGLTARANGTAVRLTWQTASEINNPVFTSSAGLRGAWAPVGYVEGRGTTGAPPAYRFTDADLPTLADTLHYRLRQVDVRKAGAPNDAWTRARSPAGSTSYA